MAKLVKVQVEGASLDHTNILRWEDDGGNVIEQAELAERLNPRVATGKREPTPLPPKLQSNPSGQ